MGPKLVDGDQRPGHRAAHQPGACPSAAEASTGSRAGGQRVSQSRAGSPRAAQRSSRPLAIRGGLPAEAGRVGHRVQQQRRRQVIVPAAPPARARRCGILARPADRDRRQPSASPEIHGRLGSDPSRGRHIPHHALDATTKRAIAQHRALLQVHSKQLPHLGLHRIGGPGRPRGPLADKHHLPVNRRLGSGAADRLFAFGFSGEPVARDASRRGPTWCLFSGDKLLGGPQADSSPARSMVQVIEKDR